MDRKLGFSGSIPIFSIHCQNIGYGGLSSTFELPDSQKPCSSVDISSLFSTGVLTRCDHRDIWQNNLAPQEIMQIGDVCEKRYTEFAAGRSQARQLIETLTGIAQPLLIGDFRQPLWPASVVGSISHGDTYCAVAVAAGAASAGLGVDVEPFEDLDADVADIVITDSERTATRELDRIFRQSGEQQFGTIKTAGMEAIAAQGAVVANKSLGHQIVDNAVSGKAHKLIFSIKEAIYKCCYPKVQAFIDFKQCEVTLDLASRTHRSVIDCLDVNGKPVHLHTSGRWMIESGHIFASAELPL